MTQPEDKKPLFRPAALENVVGTQRFEESLQVLSYRKWLTRLSVILLGMGGLIWLIWGSIPIEVRGVGIAVNVEGLYNLETAFSGFVQNIHTQVGKEIKNGDLLVVLDNPELNARQLALQQTVERLHRQLHHLRYEVHHEKTSLVKALEETAQAAEFKIQILEKDIPILIEDVRLKQKVAEKGLLHSNSLQQSQERLWSKQIDLEKTRADLLSTRFLLQKEYREDEIKILEDRLREAVKEKALVDAQIQYNHLYSPIQGLVLEWYVQPGNYVVQGQLMARLEIQGEESHYKVFYGYLPLEDKDISLGTPVEIELTSIKPQEYGAMKGHIVQVSQHAVSPEAFTRLIHNQALIDYLVQKKTAVFEVLIEPERDPQTPSGYRWTSGKGPDIQLTSGTLCVFKGLIKEERPLFYFFPVWWVKKTIYEIESFFSPSDFAQERTSDAATTAEVNF